MAITAKVAYKGPVISGVFGTLLDPKLLETFQRGMTTADPTEVGYAGFSAPEKRMQELSTTTPIYANLAAALKADPFVNEAGAGDDLVKDEAMFNSIASPREYMANFLVKKAQAMAEASRTAQQEMNNLIAEGQSMSVAKSAAQNTFNHHYKKAVERLEKLYPTSAISASRKALSKGP